MRILQLIKPDVPTVDLNVRLADITEYFVEPDIHCVPVVDDDGAIFGVITSATFAKSQEVKDTPLTEFAWEVCVREFATMQPDTSVAEAITQLQESEETFLIVADNKKYMGIVTTESLLDTVQVEDEGKDSAEAEIGVE